MLTTGRFEHLFGLLQAHGRLWGAARTALFGLVARALLVGLRLFELCPCFADDLVGGPLFGGHRRTDGLAEFMLHINWLRVLDTAERPQIDQGICHQLHPIVPLLNALKPQEEPLELVFPRKGPLDTHT